MRDLQQPNDIRSWLEQMVSRRTQLCAWLAKWSTGAILDVGCGTGDRAAFLAKQYLERRIVAVDWSQEHRIPEKQKRAAMARRDVGLKVREVASVQVLDADPSTVAWDEFQPLSFAVIDYDYSRDGLRRVTEPLLAALPALAYPNTILAWAGYQHEASESNEVFRYVNSLQLGGTHYFKGSSLAFKVFNASPEFSATIKALALFD